jgi:mannitol-1-phosphate 5-dehydrogenase
VQFGAGNIGRGFVGQLLWEGGYDIVFADVNAALVNEINRRGEYPLRLVNYDGTVQNLTICPVRAVDVEDMAAVAQELVSADFVGTSVGVSALPDLAPVLAAGITRRSKEAATSTMDILLCENQWHAAETVDAMIAPLLDGDATEYYRRSVGLVDTVVGRMVPAPAKAILREDPLLIVAEPYKQLVCAVAKFRGSAPQDIPGLVAVERFEAYEARKLFMLNACHAAFAYLGYPKHEYIWQCVSDTDVAAVAVRALGEAQAALTAEYGFDADELKVFADDMLRRFGNKALGDTVARVAGDPLRKLRPEDRLIGVAKLCVKHGIEPLAISEVIMAALSYNNPADPSAVKMQYLLKHRGISDFLSVHCGVDAHCPLAMLILAA